MLQKFRDTDIDEPVGKALTCVHKAPPADASCCGQALRRRQERTSHGMGPRLADPCLTSSWGEVLPFPRNIQSTALQSLEERFTHSFLCNGKGKNLNLKPKMK
jgi:hypothetical protein